MIASLLARLWLLAGDRDGEWEVSGSGGEVEWAQGLCWVDEGGGGDPGPGDPIEH